jgi:protein TonB
VPDPANRAPTRPAETLAGRAHGSVMLMLHLSADGTVIDAWVAESSGAASLDRAALEAARFWRFRPAMTEEGVAVPSTVRQRVTFE